MSVKFGVNAQRILAIMGDLPQLGKKEKKKRKKKSHDRKK